MVNCLMIKPSTVVKNRLPLLNTTGVAPCGALSARGAAPEPGDRRNETARSAFSSLPLGMLSERQPVVRKPKKRTALMKSVLNLMGGVNTSYLAFCVILQLFDECKDTPIIGLCTRFVTIYISQKWFFAR
jgi:hypothetical protein